MLSGKKVLAEAWLAEEEYKPGGTAAPPAQPAAQSHAGCRATTVARSPYLTKEHFSLKGGDRCDLIWDGTEKRVRSQCWNSQKVFR